MDQLSIDVLIKEVLENLMVENLLRMRITSRKIYNAVTLTDRLVIFFKDINSLEVYSQSIIDSFRELDKVQLMRVKRVGMNEEYQLIKLLNYMRFRYDSAINICVKNGFIEIYAVSITIAYVPSKSETSLQEVNRVFTLNDYRKSAKIQYLKICIGDNEVRKTYSSGIESISHICDTFCDVNTINISMNGWSHMSMMRHGSKSIIISLIRYLLTKIKPSWNVFVTVNLPKTSDCYDCAKYCYKHCDSYHFFIFLWKKMITVTSVFLLYVNIRFLISGSLKGRSMPKTKASIYTFDRAPQKKRKRLCI